MPKTELSPFEVLCLEPEQINPAIILAEKLMRKAPGGAFDHEDLCEAEETLQVSRREIERARLQFAALVKTPACAGSQIPAGF